MSKISSHILNVGIRWTIPSKETMAKRLATIKANLGKSKNERT